MTEVKKIKVLIVDDQPEWRAVTSRILQRSRLHLKLFEADSYEAGIHLMKSNFFHVAILDVRLQHEVPDDEQGRELVAYLTAMGESTGVLILSGFFTPERVRKAWKQFGVQDVLLKEQFVASELLVGFDKCVDQSEQFLRNNREMIASVNTLNLGGEIRSCVSCLPKLLQEEFCTVAQRLLYASVPFVAAPRYDFLECKGSEVLFSSKYWSRYFGVAMAVYIGGRQKINFELEKIPSTEIIHNVTYSNLAGFLYFLPGLTIQDFTDG